MIGMIPPYMQRVIDEKRDLDAKIRNLEVFIVSESFQTVQEAERERMKMQLALMRAYSGILGDRIEAFQKGVDG